MSEDNKDMEKIKEVKNSQKKEPKKLIKTIKN